MFAALFCRVRERNQSIFTLLKMYKAYKTKKGLVKDNSAARKGFVRTIITYVNNACVSSVAGGKVLVMTSSQTYSVRTIMPNSQFSNCTVNFKRFIEFSSRIFGKLRWPDFETSRKFRLMVYFPWGK